MELRKEEEISLYNELARKWQDEHLEKKDWLIDIEDYDVFIFSSYRFCRDWFEKNIKSGMKFLDLWLRPWHALCSTRFSWRRSLWH